MAKYKNTKWNRILKVGIPEIVRQYNILDSGITLRRIFYTFVGMGLIKNNASHYNRLSVKLTEARLNGDLDWKYMVDEHRVLKDLKLSQSRWYGVSTPDYAMDDPTFEQDKYVEVWIEKTGGIPIVEPICNKYFVRLISSSGRASATYKHYAYERFKEAENMGLESNLYITDFDADGEDFPKDLDTWFKTKEKVKVKVEKILLTNAQRKARKIIPDFRTYEQRHLKKKYVADFIEKYGSVQIELDAVPILDIRNILEDKLKHLIDLDVIKRVKLESVEKAKKNVRNAVYEYLEAHGLLEED